MSSEKERKLSAAEQHRKEKFDALCVKMEQDGYKAEWIGFSELATVFLGALFALPLNAFFSYFYVTLNLDESRLLLFLFGVFVSHIIVMIANLGKGVSPLCFNVIFLSILYIIIFTNSNISSDKGTLYLLLLCLLPNAFLVLMNELVRWKIFSYLAKEGRAALQFALKMDSCHVCSSLLSKKDYMGVSLFFLLLAIFMGCLSIYIANIQFFIFSQMLFFLVGNDLLTIFSLLRHRVKNADVYYLDHPTECGLVAFVKK